MKAVRIRPSGRHRRPRSGPPTVVVTSLDDLLGPAPAANGLAYCPAEQRSTFHALHATGSRTCWTCATTTAGDQ